jgi:hypothetical protein
MLLMAGEPESRGNSYHGSLDLPSRLFHFALD